MLVTSEAFEQHLVAHDLLAAAHDMQACARRLFYSYDRANKLFQGEEGQADPTTIHRGLVAVSAGITMLCAWLREVGEMMEGPFMDEANEISAWTEEWFFARSLPMTLPDEL